MRIYCADGRSSPLSVILAIVVATTIIGTVFVADSSEGETSGETVLRMGFMQKVDSMNPNVGLVDASYVFYGLVYDCLQSVDDDLKSAPNLALGCGIAEDFEPYGSVWGYNLTRNAYWHDGEPFTADDVTFTLNLNAEYYSTMWAYLPYAYFIDYAEKIDDYTVLVHFYDRMTGEPMPVAFGSSLFMPILPEHKLGTWSPADISFNWDGVFDDSDPPIIGTGPFMATENIYAEFLQGDKLTLVRNPYYHWTQDMLEVVKFDKLEMRFFDDATAMALALELGELDVAQFPPREYTVLKERVDTGVLQNVETYDGPKCDQYWTGVFINHANAGPNPSRLDPIIRQAMTMATDKAYINDNFYLGLGVPGSTLISPISEDWHYQPTAEEIYDYDLSAAESLLEAGGYRYTNSSPDVRVCTADSYAVQEGLVAEGTPLIYDMAIRQEYPEEKDIAVYLESEWAKIGVQINYRIMTEPALGAYVYSYAYDTVIWYWAYDPDPSYALFCHSKVSWGGWNDNRYTSVAYEENFTQSVQELDVDLRKEYVDNCQRIHYLDVGNIIFDYVGQTYVWRTDTFTGWGDWATNPGRSIDACWGGNPLYFDLTPAGYVPPDESCLLTTYAEVTGTEGDNGWYVSNVTVELEAVSIFDDTIAPITTVTLSGVLGDNSWFTSAVTVELEAHDDYGDVEATYYSVDGGEWQTYTEEFEISEEGNHIVVFYSVDDSGNREANRTAWTGIDWTSPSMTIDLSDGFQFNSGTVIIGLSCSDDLSGVWQCERSLDGGDYVPCDEGYVVFYDLSDGNYFLDVRVYDEAGNTAEDSVWFDVNITIPVTDRRVDYYWYDMFAHPLGPWYEDRLLNYGNEYAVTDSYPYLYVWEGSPYGNMQVNTFMQLTVNATDIPEVNMNENPEFLPFLGFARGGNAEINWHMDYLTWDEAAEKLGPGPLAWSDGWLIDLNGTVGLDRDGAKSVLGLSDSEFDDFDTWWASNGAGVKLDWQSWLNNEASNDRLATFNMYEYDLTFVYFVMDAVKVSDQVVIQMDTVSWGMEALMTRWLHEAFMPTEWYMEDMYLNATIGPDDSEIWLTAAVGYALTASETLEDGTPCWTWQAMLQDCVESSPEYSISDFDPYVDMGFFNTYPGNDWYGETMPYDYTPGAWNLSENETMTFEWPEGEVLFFAHDPGNTTSLIADTSDFWSTMTVEYAEPMWADAPEFISVDYDANQILYEGPFDMYTWSEDQTAHEWLADEWNRMGILPYGMPCINFKAEDYEAVLALSDDDDSGFSTSAILSLSDEVDYTSYRLESDDWQTYTTPFVISEDGIHTIERYSVDTEGNVEDVRTLEVKIDKTAPELALTVDDGTEFTADDVNISWTCSDACSGVDRVEYSLDDETYIECGGDEWVKLLNLSSGEHVISIRIYDEAGNSATQNLIFTVKSGGGYDLSDYALPIGIAVACAAVAIAIFLMYAMRRRSGQGPSE